MTCEFCHPYGPGHGRCATHEAEVGQIRARLTEIDRETMVRDPSAPLGWRMNYSRERELEGYRLRGRLARLDPNAPDVVRDRASWARDARA